MIQLEKFKGTKTRHTCPGCGKPREFTRYQLDGNYIADNVGICNRSSSCGYHYTPKQYFADNPQTKTNEKPKRAKPRNYGFASNPVQTQEAKPFDFIAPEHLKATLGKYERNNFVQFLTNLFPDSLEEIQNVLKMYLVGTFEDYTCFPSIDRSNHICRAKLIKFNLETGRRLKGQYHTSSLPAKLKLKDFKYKQIFFGEHLLAKFPDAPVAVVESEKSAIIGTLCFSEFIWLGSHSKQWLNAERLERIGNREIILYPDADGFDQWQTVAEEAKRLGVLVRVSSLIENHATPEQKKDGYDLADYLISEQQKINETNNFIDFYNTKLETVVLDEGLKQDLQIILGEQKAVLMIDGNLSEAEAETRINNPENLRQIVLSL